MNRKKVDVLVLGGGPAGLAAALAAQQIGASTLIIERDEALGGILQQCIHHGFGLHYFHEELTGPEYANRLIEQVQHTSIDVWTSTMVTDLTADRKAVCVQASGITQVEAGAIVLATGCRERTRGALAIPGTRPAGVYTAGCAQHLVNIEGALPGKKVVILGSGDIGLIMARRLTWEGARVLMVLELMPYSSGLNRNIVQCLQDNDIPLHFSTTVVDIHGRERLEGITIAQVDEHRKPMTDTKRFVSCDTLLLSVGLIPENELAKQAGVPLDARTGGAIVDETRQTLVPGIFACGNVLHVHDLADNASREACIAGEMAARFALGEPFRERHRHLLAGSGVRYVVPQWLSAKAQDAVEVYFRPDDVYQPARIEAHVGERLLWSHKSRICTPGEMERITLDLSGLTDEPTISLSIRKE